MQNGEAKKKVSKYIFLAVIACCFGLLAASGVLTVLLAVGLMPRYIARIHKAKDVLLFENIIVLGTMFGTSIDLFGMYIGQTDLGLLGMVIRALYGFFSGIFVGTLALAIAEMLDAFPIFFRRANITGGIRWIIFAIALGKMVGGYLYFYFAIS